MGRIAADRNDWWPLRRIFAPRQRLLFWSGLGQYCRIGHAGVCLRLADARASRRHDA